jgi:putative DNA primase/helicase
VALEWQKAATTDPDTIRRWWPPGAAWNLGVQLGPRSGIIDVECDSPRAEAELLALIGEETAVPTFKGRRGKHRLFRHTEDLPCPEKAVFKFRGIEFRTGNGGKGAQSLFPPSIHPEGDVYTWLVHPDNAELIPLPEEVLAIVRKEVDPPQRRNRSTPLSPGEKVREGQRNSTLLSMGGTMRARGFCPAAILAALEMENDVRCEPPLTEDEVLGIARSLARYEPGKGPERAAPPLRRKRAHHATRSISFTVKGGGA